MAFADRRRALLAAGRAGGELRGGAIDADVLRGGAIDADVLRGGATDAEVLRGCCVGGACLVDPRGLRLRGVRIRGRLDLAGVDVGFPLVFADSAFDEAPDLTGGSVRAPAITARRGCRDCSATACRR